MVKNIKSLFMFASLSLLLSGKLFTTNVNAANHIHNDNCYLGALHTCDGTIENGGKCYTKKEIKHVHIGSSSPIANGCYTKISVVENPASHTNDCYSQNECKHNLGEEKKYLETITCPNCNGLSFYGFNTTLQCENEQLNAYVGHCSNCGYDGNTTHEDGGDYLIGTYTHHQLICSTNHITTTYSYVLGCGKTEDTVESYTYEKTCGKESGCYYDENGNKVEPYCSNVVVSVKPKEETQKGTSPNQVLVATYLDGTTREILATRSDYDASKTYNNDKVTLYYKGIIGDAKTTKEISTTIKFTTSVTFSDVFVTNIVPKYAEQSTKNPDFTLIATYSNNEVKEVKATSSSYNKDNEYDHSIILLEYKDGDRILTTSIVLSTPSAFGNTNIVETTPIPTNTVESIESTLEPTSTTTFTPTSKVTKADNPTITNTTTPFNEEKIDINLQSSKKKFKPNSLFIGIVVILSLSIVGGIVFFILKKKGKI